MHLNELNIQHIETAIANGLPALTLTERAELIVKFQKTMQRYAWLENPPTKLAPEPETTPPKEGHSQLVIREAVEPIFDKMYAKLVALMSPPKDEQHGPFCSSLSNSPDVIGGKPCDCHIALRQHAIKRAREALQLAERTFLDYSAKHVAKGTPEGKDKAVANHQLHVICKEALDGLADA